MINYPYIFNESKWTFFIEGKPITLLNSNPAAKEIVKMVYSDKDMTETIKNKLENIPAYDVKNKIFLKNFGNFTFTSNGVNDISVTYKNLKLPSALTDKVISLYKAGCTDYTHFDKFVENIFANPNRDSVESLYSFLEACNLPITSDGCFVAYKGVREDYYSLNGNTDSRILIGKVNEDGNILNKPGETIEMVASDVDTCRENPCSTGLHVGSFDYAYGFGVRVIAVLVNPKHVIAVPNACSEKCRVSKYTVICDIDNEISEPDIAVDINDNSLKNIEKDEKLKREMQKVVKKTENFDYLSTSFREAIDNQIRNHFVLVGKKSDAQAFVCDCDYVTNNPDFNWIKNATTIAQLKGSVGRYNDLNYSTLYYYLTCLNYKLRVNSKALGKTIVQI